MILCSGHFPPRFPFVIGPAWPLRGASAWPRGQKLFRGTLRANCSTDVEPGRWFFLLLPYFFSLMFKKKKMSSQPGLLHWQLQNSPHMRSTHDVRWQCYSCFPLRCWAEGNVLIIRCQRSVDGQIFWEEAWFRAFLLFSWIDSLPSPAKRRKKKFSPRTARSVNFLPLRNFARRKRSSYFHKWCSLVAPRSEFPRRGGGLNRKKAKARSLWWSFCHYRLQPSVKTPFFLQFTVLRRRPVGWRGRKEEKRKKPSTGVQTNAALD